MTPDQTQAVLKEAHRWLNTPYHHGAAVHGAGVDCLMLLCCVYSAAGVVPWVDPRPYPTDWMLHRSEEMYLLGLGNHAQPIPAGETPQPADVITFRFGRTFSHAAIVVAWPEIIHAYLPARRVTLDSAESPAFAGRLGPAFRVTGAAP